MSYDNTNRGVLFKNDRKETDKHPDYRGRIDVGGTEYWLDAWIKTPKAGGAKFMSLSVKPKEAKAQQEAPSPQPRTDAPFSDDIPF